MRPGKINEDASVFFIYGDDDYTVKAMEIQLTDTLAREPIELNLDILKEKDDISLIRAKAEQMPCFAPHRVLVIRDSYCFDSPDGQALAAYLKNGEASLTKYIFTYSGMPDKRKALFKYLAKAAEVYEEKTPGDAELEQTIVEEAGKRGLKMSRKTAAHMLRVAGNSMFVIENELGKLAYIGKSEINEIDIDAYIAPTTDYNIFLFHGYMIKGDYAKAFELLASIKAVEKSYIPFLALLNSKFTPMYYAKLCLNAGISPSEAPKKLAEQLHIHPFAAKMAVEECRSFELPALRRAIEVIGDYDLTLKSGGTDPGIEDIVLKIYGAA